MRKRSLWIATLGIAGCAATFSTPASAGDPVAGMIIGGGIGAAIGGPPGAAVGAVIGAIVAQPNYHPHDPYYRGYYGPPAAYYAPPPRVAYYEPYRAPYYYAPRRVYSEPHYAPRADHRSYRYDDHGYRDRRSYGYPERHYQRGEYDRYR